MPPVECAQYFLLDQDLASACHVSQVWRIWQAARPLCVPDTFSQECTAPLTTLGERFRSSKVLNCSRLKPETHPRTSHEGRALHFARREPAKQSRVCRFRLRSPSHFCSGQVWQPGLKIHPQLATSIARVRRGKEHTKNVSMLSTGFYQHSLKR